MKRILSTVAYAAFLSLAATAHAQENQDCGNAAACHYNDASIDKGDTINTQDVGDHQNNTYAPDSATASATGGSVGDVIAQGGTGGSADATGNVSTNHNNSNAQIGANSQSNTGNNNTNTGGNFSQGDQTGGNFSQNQNGGDFTQGAQTGGNFSQGNQTGGSVGDTIGGNAQGGAATGGNVQGGEAHTNSGAIDNRSSVAGSGNSANRNDNRATSRNNNANRQGQAQSNRNAVSQGNTQNTNIDASTRIRHSASTAYAPGLQGYGPGNCFGDTNPSGSFTAGIQTFGWGVTAGRSKATNVCALMAVGGQRAAAAYLASQDPSAHRALIAAGIVTTPSRVRAAEEARAAEAQASIASTPWRVCEIRNGAPYIVAKRGRTDEAVSACMASLGVRPAISTTVERAAPAAIPTCPAGSRWDGKGCWMPRR